MASYLTVLALALSSASALVVSPRLAPSRPVIATNACSMIADGQTGTGTCKWFNTAKGFGFIAVDGAEEDVFVHQSDIYAPGFRSLAEGEALEFRVAQDSKTGKLKAVEVTGCCSRVVSGGTKVTWTAGKAYYIKAFCL